MGQANFNAYSPNQAALSAKNGLDRTMISFPEDSYPLTGCGAARTSLNRHRSPRCIRTAKP